MTTLDLPDEQNRPIRSFVLRHKKITLSQASALQYFWPIYGVEISQEEFVFEKLFSRSAPCIVEIGFGMGDLLISLAQHSPEINFIGIEVHRPGIGRVLAKAKELCLTNLKIFAQDAVDVFLKYIPDQSLDKVMLLFSDPWPKRKHHKRRLVQLPFAHLVAKKLKPMGQFHLATDWQCYADHILSVLDQVPLLRNCFGQGHFAPHPLDRPPTKFECRGKKLGHQIWDLLYERVAILEPF